MGAMRVCLISTELFDYGMYGGFGAATRALAQGLAKRGIEVYVIMTKRPEQKPVEFSDGFTIIGYPGQAYTRPLRSMRFSSLFNWVDADIYHSQEPSIGTFLARMGAPNKKHVVTFRDPRRLDEHKAEWLEAGFNGYGLMRREWRYRTDYEFVRWAARKADAKFGAAKVVIPRATELYALKKPPVFVPTPVKVPKRKMEKSPTPMVSFLARFDPRKRPEMFFELARRFPEVKFVAMGACQPHFKDRDAMLRKQYGDIPNLSMPGVVLGEEKSRILEQSWVLVNTSWREGLPLSYVEAAAHKCALLSGLNPDDFTSQFGYLAQEDTVDELETGLKCLLENDMWKSKGQKGYEYVNEVFEFDKAVDRHIAAYEDILTA
jgi:glycosyltransferase involved in cell wall biosynthesis